MYDELWDGPSLKLEYAHYHLSRIIRVFQPPNDDGWTAAMQSTGAIVDRGIMRTVYPSVDALLSTARSVSPITRCCFGWDKVQGKWLRTPDADEQGRRKEFDRQLNDEYALFDAEPLTHARHVSEHRKGLAPIEVTVSGRWGVVYVGSPDRPIRISESRNIEGPNAPHFNRQVPVEPRMSDLTKGGAPLYEECSKYLAAAGRFVQAARAVCESVHRGATVTTPPG